MLDAGERGHMADVRTVLLDLGLVALIAALILLVAGVASRGRRWFWHAVELGGKLLVGGVAVVGVAFAIFFEQAFELFHEIFFKPGTYSFDPAKEKLVQLFPDQFRAASYCLCAMTARPAAIRFSAPSDVSE